MYAHQVSMQLMPDSRADFLHKIESEVLPLLRRQAGFQDEITLVNPVSNVAMSVSLWDSKANVDAYQLEGFAEVAVLLSKLIDGAPRVGSYQVYNSTFHKIAPGLEAA